MAKFVVDVMARKRERTEDQEDEVDGMQLLE